MKLLHCLTVSLFRFLPAFAGGVQLPSAPSPAFVDCESVTNAPIQAAMLRHARVLTGKLTLFATPSNMVEVAFGTSRNGDGVLLPGDEAFAVGWRGGAWFFASPTNRVESASIEGAGLRTLAFRLRLSADGEPRGLSFADPDSETFFPSLVNAPPSWLFSREWDVVRLTIRGVDAPSEDVSVRFEADPRVLLFR